MSYKGLGRFFFFFIKKKLCGGFILQKQYVFIVKKKIENINKKIIINSQKLNHDLEKIKFFMYVCIIYTRIGCTMYIITLPS